ncbi:MAG TPA: metal-dependent transcriptional regulator [Anaerolineales bacterium]|nr:metal-dependent transcriptional regulator [Anaerolineales bacterium]
MMLSEHAQELLERLWISREEEGKDGFLMDTAAAGSLEELARAGLAEPAGESWRLTGAGLPEAARAIRRHRLAERLLADVLLTDDAMLDEQACRLEHALLDGLDDSICTLLGHPQFCPHGRQIPNGECCRQMRATVERLIAPLNELEPGQRGQIAYIQMANPARLQKLMAMGVLPGGCITLLRRSPSYVFETGYTQFAVDEEIAADIFVRLAG